MQLEKAKAKNKLNSNPHRSRLGGRAGRHAGTVVTSNPVDRFVDDFMITPGNSKADIEERE